MAMAALARVPVTGQLGLAALGMACLAIWAAGVAGPGPAAGVAGLAILMAATVLAGLGWQQRARAAAERRDSLALVGANSAPCFLTDGEGRIVLRNSAATDRKSVV